MAEITIQTTADVDDVTIIHDQPTTNYNTLGEGIRIGERNDASTNNRALIKFDLSGIPSNATIESAVLSIRATTDKSSNARTFSVYRVLRVWVDSQATWNVYSTGNNWGTAGCANTTTDREASNIGTRNFTATETLNQFKDFTLTAAKIEEMINGTLTNNGFLIQSATESDDCYYFNSTEDGTEENNPKLVITYTVPSGGAFLFSMI